MLIDTASIASPLPSDILLAEPVVADFKLAAVEDNPVKQRQILEANQMFLQAVNYYQRDQLALAIQSWQRALALFQDLASEADISKTLGILGLSYGVLGQYPQAIDYLQQNIALQQDQPTALAAAWTDLGIVYGLQQDYPAAINAYQRSLEIYRASDERDKIPQVLLDLGLIQQQAKQYAKALQYYQQSLEITGDDNAAQANILSKQAKVYRLQGDYPAAIAHYQQSLALYQQLGKIPPDILLDFAEVYQALQQYPKAIALLEQSLAQYSGAEQSSVRARHQLGMIYQQLGDYPQATDQLRKAVAQQALVAPLESLAERSDNPGIDPYQSLQQVLLAQAQPAAALQIAEQRRHDQLAGLYQIYAGRKLATPNFDIASFKAIAEREQATIVEYALVATNQLHIYQITAAGEVSAQAVTLPVALAELIAAAAKQHWQADSPAMQTLTQILIAPLQLQSEQPLIIIPDAALYRLPFAALRDKQGRALIEQHSLRIAPALVSLQQTTPQVAADSRTNALVIGNPVMPLLNGQPLTALPETVVEAEQIARLLHTTALLGAQATETSVKQLSGAADIIHFATHSAADRQDINLPGYIALSPDKQNDGMLTPNEIAELDLSARLVVLSHYDFTTVVDPTPGISSLATAFAAAGVTTILLSQWPTKAEITQEFMAVFYQQLAKHPDDKAQALRQTMLLQQQKYPDKPENWAGFMVLDL